jgi:two-component system sensor histidine kinase/response regulator
MSHFILVADDDADIRLILSTILKAAGYSVILASDGLEAAEKIKGGLLPDLAILDIAMPGMDGDRVCRVIREIPEFGPIVGIIMVTARDGLADKLKSLDGGADDYVTKPFNHEELLARVRAALRIHDLSLELHRTRAQLVEQERKNAVTELAGSAAHALNQPLAAIKLNVHLLELLDRNDERFLTALRAVKGDADRLGELIEKMRGAAGNERLEYHAGKKVIDL